MTMQTYAEVDKTNTVINLVLWDGETKFDVSPNTLTPTNGDVNAQIGGAFVSGVFSPAPPPISDTPIDTPAKAIAALSDLLGADVAKLIGIAAGVVSVPIGPGQPDQAESVPSVGP